MSERIYNTPGVPHYGVVRRAWMMLVQMGIITWTDDSKADKPFNKPWDVVLQDECETLKENGVLDYEARATRMVLYAILLVFTDDEG